MKLLLTSSGICNPPLRNAFLNLLPEHQNSIHTVFVPTAADPETDKSFVESARAEISALSTSIEDLDLKLFDESSLEHVLSKATVLFVSGGNTFYLLHWARQSGLEKAVRSFLDRGGIYVGVSAGSILCSPTIDSAGLKGFDDPRIVDLADLRGLDVVPFHIFVHYHEKWDALIDKSQELLQPEVVTLKDGEAILINGTAREKISPQ